MYRLARNCIKRRPLFCASRRFLATTPAASSGAPLVLGCGSNVVDKFHLVKVDSLFRPDHMLPHGCFCAQKMPKAGEKGYFAGDKVETASVVGGVTLNHLSWASVLGVPTGLLALQGDDP